MSRRTLLDVADLLRARGRIPGYGVATTASKLRVEWCCEPWAVAVASSGYLGRRLFCSAPEASVFRGRGWVERMASAIEAAVHEDARRQDRWSPEVWAEVG